MSNRIVFIDSHIANYQSLIAQLPKGTDAILLDAERDGIEQILAALQGRTNLDAIDILSHGSPGTITLGSGVLNNDNLDDYAEQLAQIGRHLKHDGDILLYGCEVAKGTIGQEFIERLSLLTGADVAASTTLTGAPELGGDWVLGAQIGSIQAKIMQLSYDGVFIAGTLSEGETFLISSYIPSNNNVVLTALTNGGYMVTWMDPDNHLHGQRYDASNILLDSNNLGDWMMGRNSYSQFMMHRLFLEYSQETITALTDGNFVHIYYDDYSGVMYAYRTDWWGNPIGDQLPINTSLINSSFNFVTSEVTATANGGFIVTWMTQQQDETGNWSEDIFAQRFDSSNTALGDEFRVNTFTPGNQWFPSIAVLKDGSFVIAWSDNGYAVAVKQYAADGTTLKEQFPVGLSAYPSGSDIKVTALENGGFVVTWKSSDPSHQDQGAMIRSGV